jgi:hypothetical protein
MIIHRGGVTGTLFFNIVPFTVEEFVIVFGLYNLIKQVKYTDEIVCTYITSRSAVTYVRRCLN